MFEDIGTLLMSVEQMRKELGISKTAAYALTRRPDFPTVNIGNNRVFISRAALEEWLRTHTKGACNE